MLRQLPLDDDDTVRARSRAGRGAMPETVTDLAGFFSILARYWLSIVLLTLLGVCAGVGYLTVVPPTFTASTTLLIDPRSKKVVNDDLPQAASGPDLGLLESQVAIIRSDAVLGRVVDRLKLATDPDFVSLRQGLGAKFRAILGIPNRSPDARTQAIATLAEIVTVRRAQKTYVVEIDANSSEPVRAAELASAVASAYISDQTTAKSDEAKRANDLIEGRLDELRQQVRSAETRIDEFRKQNSILTSEGGTVGEQQLTRLNSELITARSQASEARARYDEVTAAARSGNFETITDPAKTGLVQRLREQLAQVARREAALSAQLLPRHPVVLDIRSQVTEIRAQINGELRRLAQTAKSELAVAEARERELIKSLDKAKSEVGRNNTAQIRQRELEQELNASRELLRVFLTRSKETDEQQKLSTPDARVISPPSIPSRPTKPIPALVLALGLIGGLAAGVTRALLGDMFDRRIRTAAGASAVTGLATLAAIPLVGTGALPPRRRRKLVGGRLSEPAPSLIERSPMAGIALAASGEAGQAGQDFRRAIVTVLNRVRRRSLAQPP
ncbi:MAG: GumC family protein, partial [Hyphomicrobiaceae bacterium]|nr:GumC family protein [Hyphomicrobiaceae bacterium]